MARTFLAVLVAGIAPLLVLTLIVTGTGFGLVAWQPPNIWTVRFGTPNSFNQVTALAVDSTGLYAAGYVGYDIGFYAHPTPSYLFLSKYDLGGRQVWIRQLGPLNISDARTVAVGSNALYIAGLLNSRSFIQKYDLSGNQARDPTSGGIDPMSLSVGPNSLFAAGESSSYYRNGVRPLILREYDFNGNTVWTDNLGNSTGSRPSVYATSTGVYATSEVACSGCDSIVAKYELNGTLDWARQIKDSSNSTHSWTSNSITGDSTGIYVGGEFWIGGISNDFIQKYDSNGRQVWSIQIAAPDYSGLGDLNVSANTSGVYLATATIARKPLLMKYDENGNQVWSFQVPESGHLSAGENNVYVAGGVNIASGSEAYLASFSQSSSLELFGLNPPLSFVILGSLVTGTGIGVYFLRRRYYRRMSKRPGSAPPERYRNSHRNPNPHA